MPRTNALEKDSEAPPQSPPQSSEEPRHGTRHKALKWGLGALAVAVIVGFVWWLLTRNRQSTDDAQVNGHLVPISSRVSGSVLQIMVHDNEHVDAGQVLVQLDPRDYAARVAQFEAAVAVAEARANAAKVGVPLTRATTTSGTAGAASELTAAEADYARAQQAARQVETSGIAVAQANLAQAQANNTKARADLARMRALVVKQEVSRQQYDAYVAAAHVAASRLRAAEDELTAARQTAANARDAAQAAQARVGQARAALQQSRAGQQQVNVSAAQAQSAAAAVKQARANLDAAELDLGYTTIKAPVSGEVTEKTVQPGEIVQPGQELMLVVPLHNVWVTANFKETQLAHVHPGDKATVHVDMYDKDIEGQVNSIAGATGAKLSLLPPENATGNFVKVVERIPVKITFPRLPPGVVLRPGTNVTVTIYTK